MKFDGTKKFSRCLVKEGKKEKEKNVNLRRKIGPLRRGRGKKNNRPRGRE